MGLKMPGCYGTAIANLGVKQNTLIFKSRTRLKLIFIRSSLLGLCVALAEPALAVSTSSVEPSDCVAVLDAVNDVVKASKSARRSTLMGPLTSAHESRLLEYMVGYIPRTVDGKVQMLTLDLSQPEQLTEFRSFVRTIKELVEKQEASSGTGRKSRLIAEDYGNLRISGEIRTAVDSLAALLKQRDRILNPGRSETPFSIGDKDRRLLTHIHFNMAAISASIAENAIPPLEQFSIGFFLRRAVEHVWGSHKPGQQPDELTPGRLESDPVATTLWQQRQEINEWDLYVNGPGFLNPPPKALNSVYLKPKSGFGVHAGFRVNYEHEGEVHELKIRVGVPRDINPGIVISRLITAMGYNTYSLNFLPELRVSYRDGEKVSGRNLIMEYNSRKSFSLSIATIAGYKVENQRQIFRDPFVDINEVILKDGTRVAQDGTVTALDGTQSKGAPLRDRFLKRRLGLNETPKADDFDSQFENLVDQLVFKNVSIEHINPSRKRVGRFNWRNPIYMELREFRAVGFLVGFFRLTDLRADNTRLLIVKQPNGTWTLEHNLSDVDNGLGGAGILPKQSDPSIMAWDTFEIKRGQRGQQDRVVFNTRAVEVNPVATAMTIPDAIFALKQLLPLTIGQFEEALASSNYSAAELILFREKLLYSRDQLLSQLSFYDTGLKSKFSQFRAISDYNKQFSYDPKQDPRYDPAKDALIITTTSGLKVEVPVRGQVIRDGEIH